MLRSLTLAREQRLNFYLYNKLNKRALRMNVLRLHIMLAYTKQVGSWLSKSLLEFFPRLDVIAIFKYGTTELSKSLPGRKWKNLTLVHFLFFFFLPCLHPTILPASILAFLQLCSFVKHSNQAWLDVPSLSSLRNIKKTNKQKNPCKRKEKHKCNLKKKIFPTC